MPHDSHGLLIERGDQVVMKFDVNDVFPSNRCNVHLVAVRPDGYSGGGYSLTCDAELVTKLDPVTIALAAESLAAENASGFAAARASFLQASTPDIEEHFRAQTAGMDPVLAAGLMKLLFELGPIVVQAIINRIKNKKA